jgi:osmotically-inducible protein OsmY
LGAAKTYPTRIEAATRYESDAYRRKLDSQSNGDIAMKNDTQIQQEVLAELQRDDTLPRESVGVEVHHGVVKLAGRNNDAAIKKSAEMAARKVSGVRGIVLDMGMGQR